jgi:hypothetical protein
VIIPQAVYHELQDPHTPKQVKDWIDSAPAWIEIRHADLSFYTSKKNLGAGEREAIALALELRADALLLDDRDGTKEARKQNIPTLSTFGILSKKPPERTCSISRTQWTDCRARASICLLMRSSRLRSKEIKREKIKGKEAVRPLYPVAQSSP